MTPDAPDAPDAPETPESLGALPPHPLPVSVIAPPPGSPVIPAPPVRIPVRPGPRILRRTRAARPDPRVGAPVIMAWSGRPGGVPAGPRTVTHIACRNPWTASRTGMRHSDHAGCHRSSDVPRRSGADRSSAGAELALRALRRRPPRRTHRLYGRRRRLDRGHGADDALRARRRLPAPDHAAALRDRQVRGRGLSDLDGHRDAAGGRLAVAREAPAYGGAGGVGRG